MQSDADVVEAVLDGDRAAFAVLVSRHERAVLAAAWGTLRDHHAAQDAAQEAFVAAYRRLGTLRNQANFGAWVLKIARREAVRMARRRSRGPHQNIPSDALAETDNDPPRHAVEELLAAVMQLPQRQRQFVLQHYFDGLSVEEIGRLTGRPVGTVTKYLSRAYDGLRRRLKRQTT